MLTRRDFLALTAAALPCATGLQSRRVSAQIARDRPMVNGARLRARLERLSAFGRPAGAGFDAGVSRVAYSDADVAARTWLLDELRGAGLTPRIDPAGNIFARTTTAAATDTPAILFG